MFIKVNTVAPIRAAEHLVEQMQQYVIDISPIV